MRVREPRDGITNGVPARSLFDEPWRSPPFDVASERRVARSQTVPAGPRDICDGVVTVGQLNRQSSTENRYNLISA